MKGSEEKPARRGGRIVRKAIAFVLIALVVYCCVYCLIAKAVKGEALPMPLGFGIGVVLTGSMEPTYSANDLIFVTKAKQYKVGDIVVYQTGGTPVVHRIVQAEDNGVVVTKGDANNVEDEPVSVTRIKGRVLFAIPFVGAVMQFVKTVPGMIMILVFLFVLLFLSIRSREQEDEEQKKKAELEREIGELKELVGDKADTRSETEKEIERLRALLGSEADPDKNK